MLSALQTDEHLELTKLAVHMTARAESILPAIHKAARPKIALLAMLKS